MNLKAEESKNLIEKAYKEVLTEMVERFEKSMNAMNVNAHIMNAYLKLKNHAGLMDLFAIRIINIIKESKLIKDLDIQNLILDANGHGCFELKVDDKLICKIFLAGRQSEAFDIESNLLKFKYSFNESKEEYPYIHFFDDNLNKMYKKHFESIGKDYKIATSMNKILTKFRNKEFSNLNNKIYIKNKSIEDFDKKDLFSNLNEIYYEGNVFYKKLMDQKNLEYIYNINNGFSYYEEIKDFDTFQMILKNFKINKKFFKSIGLFLMEPNMFIEKGDFFFVLKNKNKDCVTLRFPINFEIKEIAESKILDHNDKPTTYTIRDYIKNPEEVIDYIKMIAY